MNRERGKQLALVALILVLLVVGGMRLSSFLPGSGGSVGGPGAAAAAGARGTSLEKVVELRLADLEIEPGEYSPGRDPFRYGTPPPPPPPPPPTVDPQDQARARDAALAAARARATSSAAPPRPQPPPVDVVYLGSFGSNRRRLAVFSDGNDIFNAMQGGVVKEKFIVEQVGYESVDLGFVGFPDAPPERLAVGG